MIPKIVPYRRWHLAWLQEKGPAMGGAADISEEGRSVLEQHKSWTAVVDGNPIACGGTVELWSGRHSAWAYLNETSAKHMRLITNGAKMALAEAKGRIEMSVRVDFMPGHKWARMLDFQVETPILHNYGPDGAAHVGYVRFN